MKVLFVCHRVPFPPKRGGKIRPFNIIRHLTTQGHQRHRRVACAQRRRGSTRPRAVASTVRARIVEVIPNSVAWPRMVALAADDDAVQLRLLLFRRAAAAHRQGAGTHSYDLIFVHCSSVAPYVPIGTGPAKIFDFGDMDSQKWREYSASPPVPASAGYWLEAVKLERTERLLARNSTCARARRAARWIRCGSSASRSRRTGFRTASTRHFFAPTEAPLRTGPDHVRRSHGLFSEPAGRQLFCRRRSAGDSTRAGRPCVSRSSGPIHRARSGSSASCRGVIVTGSVPDVRPYVTRAALTVAPLEIARGTQNKILESMAMGVPVVCSEHASGRRRRCR